MYLRKENILSFQLNETILIENFIKIEDQFKKMKREIEYVKKNSSAIVNKINQLDPFDQIEDLQLINPHSTKELEDKEETDQKQR